MLSKSLIVASLLALTAAAEEPNRPRIYYPRHVKRQFGNSTTSTVFDTSSSQELTSSSTSSSSKRDDDPLGSAISSLLGGGGGGGKSSSADATTVVISSYVYVLPTSEPTTTTDTGILVGPTGIVSGGSSSPTTTTSTKLTPTTTSGGLLDPLNTLVTDILPVGAKTSNATSHATTSAPASESTGDREGRPTTTTEGLLPSLSIPDLSSLLPAPSTSATGGLIPNITTSAGGPYGTPSTTSQPFLPPLGGGSTTSSAVPVDNSTSSTSILQTPPTSLAQPTTGTPSQIGNTTNTETNVPSSTPTSNVSSHSEIPATSTISTPVSTSTQVGTPVTSIHPTHTLSNTDWLPSTIIAEQTTFTWTPPTETNTATASALPSNVPKQIKPDNDEPVPEGTIPIQIGFEYPLNWLFVSEHTTAASQIFTLLPKALADAGDFNIDKIQISTLVPYNTEAKWGYITTIVKLYYPKNMVDTLQTQLWAPNSALYNNELSIVRNLTNVINPQIDLYGEGSDSTGTDDSGSDDKGSSQDSFNANDGGDQSSKQKATTAGIAVGAFGLSVMYGAAMFIVARRYKRKKQAHRRTNSITSSQASSEMGYTAGSPPLMGGALLSRDMSGYGGTAGGRDSHGSGRSGGSHSARTANISAPVAAENSLGWN